MLLLTLLFIFLLNRNSESLLSRVYKDYEKRLGVPLGADAGEPLILTPFLKNGSILEAQKAAVVQNSKFLGLTSYAGYFTVDDRFDSNMWFWYFPSAGNVSEDPVILWLNGGPGASSLNGLFDENGPFIINEGFSVTLREYSWHKNHSLIYVDNPVGVGFSFTNGGLAENETKVGDDMYSALTQFFQLFPDLQTNPFFISGESYAGKFLPAIGHAILKNSPLAESKINFQGLLIGDGWTDPINQLNYGPYVYNTGLVSAAVKEEIDNYRNKAVELIKAGDFAGASDQWANILGAIGDAADVGDYNYVIGNADDDVPDYWPDFLNQEETRKSLHVGNITFGDKGATLALLNDKMQSAAPWVEELLEHYKILVYTGQLDIICGYPMVVDYLQTLNFTGVEDYHNASRAIWTTDLEPSGYVKSSGNLVELLVRNAGHMVPSDQPKSAYDMVYRFTRNIPFA